MNTFHGDGNLGQDPELNEHDGTAVCNLRIYFDRPVPTGDDGYEDRGGFWLDAEIWGKQAEAVARCLRKGARVAVRGYLVDDSYETDDGMQIRIKLRAKTVSLVLMSNIEGIRYRKDEAA